MTRCGKLMKKEDGACQAWEWFHSSHLTTSDTLKCYRDSKELFTRHKNSFFSSRPADHYLSSLCHFTDLCQAPWGHSIIKNGSSLWKSEIRLHLSMRPLDHLMAVKMIILKIYVYSYKNNNLRLGFGMKQCKK